VVNAVSSASQDMTRSYESGKDTRRPSRIRRHCVSQSRR
jgi:hypothetical protein